MIIKKRKLLLIFFFSALSFIGTIILINVLAYPIIIDYYSPWHHSFSIEESICEKRFVKKVKVIPDSSVCNYKTIAIKESWIEESIQLQHTLLFFKIKYIHTGNYFLCFTSNINNDDIYKIYNFERDSLNTPSRQCSGGEYVLYWSIDNTKSDTIFARLISKTKDSCKNLIKFIIPK